MKKIFGLVLGAMLLPLSVAHAGDLTVIYTNNMFANAVSIFVRSTAYICKKR